MVHSIYYLSPDEVLGFVTGSNKNMVVSIQHDFPYAEGVMWGGESSYCVDECGMVRMTALGNLPGNDYVHPNPTWLKEGYHDNGRFAMSWKVTARTETTTTITFVLSEPFKKRPAPEVTLWDSIGGVDGASDILTARYGPTACAVIGGDLLAVTGAQRVVIPSDLFADAKAHCVNKPRSEVLLGQLTTRVKNQIRTLNHMGNARTDKHVRVGITRVDEVAMYTIALAFSANVDCEIGLLEANQDSAKYAKHAELLKVTQERKPWWYAIRLLVAPIVGGFATGVFVRMVTLIRRPAIEWGTERLVTVSRIDAWDGYVVEIVPGFVSHGAAQFLRRNVGLASVAFRGNGMNVLGRAFRTGVLGASVGTMGYVLWSRWRNKIPLTALAKYWAQRNVSWEPTGTEVFKVGHITADGARPQPPLKPQEPGSLIIPPLDDKARERPMGAQLTGVGVFSAMPQVTADTIENEQLSISNRITLAILEGEDTAFYCTWFEKHIETLLPHDGTPLEPVPFATWVSRFDAPKQKRYRAAREILDKEGWTESSVTAKTFLKREKLTKTVGSESTEYTPRPVTTYDDRYQVAVGPWVCAVLDRLRLIWGPNGETGTVLTAGLDGHEIGDVFARFCEEEPGCIPVEGDFGTFDASIRGRKARLELVVWKHFGFGEEPMAAIRAKTKSVKGEGSHGTKFELTEPQRGSGEPQTMVGNSVADGCANRYVASKLEALTALELPVGTLTDEQWERVQKYMLDHSPVKLKQLVIGDDNVCWHKRGVNSAWLVVEYRKLGFNYVPQLREDVRDVEFCSGTFWPVDDAGKRSLVYVPNIGRFFAKSGWAVRRQDCPPEYYKGVLTGFADTYSGIPVAGDFIRIMLAKMKDVGSKPSSAATRAGMGEHAWRARLKRRVQVHPDGLAMFEHRYGRAALDSMKGPLLNLFRKAVPGSLIGDPSLHAIVERDHPAD
jgi:hypothetical protein